MLFFLVRLFLILGIFSALLYFLMIVIVPQNYAYIMERLGRYHKTLQPGMYFLIPFLDKIMYKLSMKEQSQSLKNLVCQTADGIEFFVDSVFVFQIQDPVKAAYETENYFDSILQEIQSHIITEIQNHHSDEIFARRYGMNQSVVKHLGESAKNWGIKIIRFEIQQLTKDVKIT